MQKLLTLAFLSLLFCQRLQATHIVGGEITYNCLGNDQYEITLSVYRDCYNGQPYFDQPAIIGIEIRRGEDVLKLRDSDGIPLWVAWRKRAAP